MSHISPIGDRFIVTSPLDPRAETLVEDLIRDYDERYGTLFSAGGARDELFRYPSAAFEPPNGLFLILQREGETIGGGAFMRYDATTAEFKRIWTRADLRRQGLARRIVQELEGRAAKLGFSRVFLTTGFRQPEAMGLYLGLDYRPLFDVEQELELYGTLPFEKHIGQLAGQPGRAAIKQPAATAEEAARAVLAYKAAASARVQGEIQ